MVLGFGGQDVLAVLLMSSLGLLRTWAGGYFSPWTLVTFVHYLNQALEGHSSCPAPCFQWTVPLGTVLLLELVGAVGAWADTLVPVAAWHARSSEWSCDCTGGLRGRSWLMQKLPFQQVA